MAIRLRAEGTPVRSRGRSHFRSTSCRGGNWQSGEAHGQDGWTRDRPEKSGVGEALGGGWSGAGSQFPSRPVACFAAEGGARRVDRATHMDGLISGGSRSCPRRRGWKQRQTAAWK
jgi:hypothetical protein